MMSFFYFFQCCTSSLNSALGMQQGKLEGIQEGIQKGMQQGKLETARSFKSIGVEIDKIATATGLSKEEIESL